MYVIMCVSVKESMYHTPTQSAEHVSAGVLTVQFPWEHLHLRSLHSFMCQSVFMCVCVCVCVFHCTCLQHVSPALTSHQQH